MKAKLIIGADHVDLAIVTNALDDAGIVYSTRNYNLNDEIYVSLTQDEFSMGMLDDETFHIEKNGKKIVHIALKNILYFLYGNL